MQSTAVAVCKQLKQNAVSIVQDIAKLQMAALQRIGTNIDTIKDFLIHPPYHNTYLIFFSKGLPQYCHIRACPTIKLSEQCFLKTSLNVKHCLG